MVVFMLLPAFRVLVLSLICVIVSSEPSILLAMMARNEEDNFRANLPKWRSVIDAIVVGIDDRTSDGTHLAVVESLPDIPRWLFYHHFEGFGIARTKVFKEAWRKFQNMTHILVADPDWEPQLPLSKTELDYQHLTFQFKIYDRNAHTTRLSDWLMCHQPNLSFTYRLHEQLHVPSNPAMPYQSKFVNWEVREVEVKNRRSWHNADANHGHSQSYNRYLFDLNLLEQDYKDLPDDPHVLYYLGATNFAALEAMLGRGEHAITPELTHLINTGIKYLELRLQDHHVNNLQASEQTWASMRWLAYSYQYFQVNFEKAEYWYRRCVEFDPPRADCPVFLSKLYRSNGHVDRAWEVVSKSLKTPFEERRFANNFYVFHCSLPLEASLTVLNLITQNELELAESLSPIFFFGWKLLRKAQVSCNSSTVGYLMEDDQVVVEAEATYRQIANGGISPGQPSPLELMDLGEVCARAEGTSDDLIGMLKQWGVNFC